MPVADERCRDGMRCAVPLALAALDSVFGIGPDIYVECVVADVVHFSPLQYVIVITGRYNPLCIRSSGR